MTQQTLFSSRPAGQLLKWVGNKFRFSNQIVGFFPKDYKIFYEPFVGTGAVLATLQPKKAVASDTLKPLIDLWHLVQKDSNNVSGYYERQWNKYLKDRVKTYEAVKKSYNKHPNPLDLLFISRTCYGGVIRFTKQGTISTPIGPHKPIPPKTFERRLEEWKERVKNTTFIYSDYKITMRRAKKGDLIYCDPPYQDSQSILYGAQSFKLKELFKEIQSAKKRGAKIALSIDGEKKSGLKKIELGAPKGLFVREAYIDIGYSMLKRFQNNGGNMNGEGVKERLLLTW